ncbi:MAG: A/G-specific adenine glycosylase [Burkholderiales bacterium]|nr:A/G-specific adenine glycosylase [Burkholderiales bacterium]
MAARQAPQGRAFSARIVAWQARHGRHDLPWQGTRDAYRIWVSEIMLQQTQVAAVIGYYARFLDRFPDVRALAAADLDHVMQSWSGLGYYSRARNLHRAAQTVMHVHGGKFPDSPEALAALPGIGRSTAAAIACFAYGRRAAILDGNVKRVLARQFGVAGYPGSGPVEARLWRLAEEQLPQKSVEGYTQGLMDLGATLCVRGVPACSRCPVADTCVALRTGRTASLPERKPARAIPHKQCVMPIIRDRSAVLLHKRAPTGIWGGLLCLPECADMAAARSFCEALGGDWAARRELAPVEHGFTHYRLTIRPLEVRLERKAGLVADTTGHWLMLGEAAAAALPAPVKKILVGIAAQSPAPAARTGPAARPRTGAKRRAG